MYHTSMPDTLGQTIRQMREARNMTQKDLAEKALGGARNQAQLSRYENDVFTPSVDALVRIARAFNCQLSDLLPVAHSKTQEAV